MVMELSMLALGIVPFSVNSLQEVIFLFLHVVGMLGNVVATSGNIVTT